MADFISFDQGVYTFQDVDERFAKPNIIPTNAAQSYGMTISAVDTKSTKTILSIISPGSKGNVGLTTGNKAISAVGVLFNYTGGQTSMNSVSTRCISLSAPHHGGGVNTVIATSISSAFDCAVIYGDHTTIRYAPSAYTDAKVQEGGGIAPTQPCNMSEPGVTTSTDAVGPNIRRLANLGYL